MRNAWWTAAPEGFVETSSVDDADLVILNTATSGKRHPRRLLGTGRLRVAKDEAGAMAPYQHRVAGCARRPRAMRSSAAHRWSMCGRPAKLSHLPQLLAARQSTAVR